MDSITFLLIFMHLYIFYSWWILRTFIKVLYLCKKFKYFYFMPLLPLTYLYWSFYFLSTLITVLWDGLCCDSGIILLLIQQNRPLWGRHFISWRQNTTHHHRAVGYIGVLKCHLVVLLGARIEGVMAQNFITYQPPLPVNKNKDG